MENAMTGQQLELPSNNLVECFQKSPMRSLRQIWCFPHAGSGAAEFSAWSKAADEDALICAIRYPGREWRYDQPFDADMSVLSRAIAEQIAPLVSAGAVFYGQCFGALVALEVAAQLAQRPGGQPAHLFIASQPPPDAPQAPEIKQLPSLDPLAFRRIIKYLGGVPSNIDDDSELWEIIEPALRADFGMLSGYATITRQIPVAITALVGDDDQQVAPRDLEGWCTYTSASFDLHIVRGGHFLSRSPAGEALRMVQGRNHAGPS